MQFLSIFLSAILTILYRLLQSNYFERFVYAIQFLGSDHHISSCQAQERQETQFRAPKQRIEDYEELHEYRGRKRKEFEERIRRTRGSM